MPKFVKNVKDSPPEALMTPLKRYTVMHKGGMDGISVWDREERKTVAKRFKTFRAANGRADKLNKEWSKKYRRDGNGN